jgi:hypothetical protein
MIITIASIAKMTAYKIKTAFSCDIDFPLEAGLSVSCAYRQAYFRLQDIPTGSKSEKSPVRLKRENETAPGHGRSGAVTRRIQLRRLLDTAIQTSLKSQTAGS